MNVIPATYFHEKLAVRMACAECAQKWAFESRQRGVFRILEIGVCKAETANLLVQDLLEAEISYEYVGVDDYSDVAGAADYFAHPNMRLVNGNSRHPATIAAVGKPFHFLYIDGDHRYEGALADVLNYTPLLVPGYCLAMHDIDCLCGEVYRQLLRSPDWRLYHEWHAPLGDCKPALGILEKLR